MELHRNRTARQPPHRDAEHERLSCSAAAAIAHSSHAQQHDVRFCRAQGTASRLAILPNSGRGIFRNLWCGATQHGATISR
jgi:hypothetical protein